MSARPSYEELEKRIAALEQDAIRISRIEAVHKEYEIQYRALFDSANDTIILMDRDLIIDCNKRTEELFRCSREEIVGASPVKFWPERQPNGQLTSEFAIEKIRGALHREKRSYELTHRRLDGTLVDTDVTLNLFEVKGEKYLQAIIRDITESKAAKELLRQSEERYRTILEDIEEGCYEVDLEGNFTFFNNSFCKILGYMPEDMLGLSYRDITDEEHSKKFFNTFNFVFKTGIPNPCLSFLVMTREGKPKDVEVSVSLIKTVDDKPAGFRGILRDITERKKNEEMIAYMAYHDPLTGLPNRRLFDDRLYVALEFVKRSQKKLAVMLMDLDKFKEVNDTLGHQMGDKLLKEVSLRISGLVRKSDTLARMGGDEFMTLLMPEIHVTDDVMIVANRIIRAFRDPFNCNGTALYTSASLGIAIFPEHGDNVETLISRADIAMYEAKKTGRNNFKIYS